MLVHLLGQGSRTEAHAPTTVSGFQMRWAWNVYPPIMKRLDLSLEARAYGILGVTSVLLVVVFWLRQRSTD